MQGAEIKPRLCPYCHGGQHGDKYTFALNMDKHTFICLRGSCGKQGHFSQLLRDFGEQPDKVYAPLVTRSYVKPQPPKISREGAAMQYIGQRGISEQTAAAYGVGGNTQGEVVFPYYETPEAFQTGQPVFDQIPSGAQAGQGRAQGAPREGHQAGSVRDAPVPAEKRHAVSVRGRV